MASNVLIVDDSATMRKIVMRGIRQAGFEIAEIKEAGDGVQALEVLDGGGVDVVLSDVNMPNMNGLEFVSAAREKYGDKPPIVMITTEGSEEVVAEAMKKGANGYIKKPFTPDKVKEVVGSYFD
jgi:two-component system chemotaxis response regulator CheY